MEKILREFPHSFETERLTIRCPMPGDGPEVNAAILESWEEIKYWLPFAVEPKPTEEETEANVRKAHLRFLSREDLRLHLYLKGTDIFVGSSGLHRINWDVPKFEIGYWIRTQFGGQGYISEAVQAISDFAFDVLEARRVEIRCDALNERSAAVPRRLGFTLEGKLRNDDRDHITGELRDTLIFARVRTGS